MRWALGLVLSHAAQIFFLQNRQLPQAMVNGTTTRSPRFEFVTSLPTSSTIPMNSWPRMSPASMVGMKPSYRCRSEPQIAVRVILMMASCGFSNSGSGTVQRFNFTCTHPANSFHHSLLVRIRKEIVLVNRTTRGT